MTDVGQMVFDFFSPFGPWGMLACIFVLFYVDAIVFPTVPELFTVIIFMAIPELWFGLTILGTIAVAEVLGLSTLYIVVRRIKVPRRIEGAVKRYRRFLVVGDERIILVNRVAPVIPFIGAFVAICNWSFRKAIAYTLAGGMAKYGIILALSGVFFAYLQTGMAQTVTIIMILVIIAISFVFSYIRSRKMRKANEDCGC